MPLSLPIPKNPYHWQVRSHCVLTVPILGQTSAQDTANHGSESVELPVRVKSFTLERNDHFTADTLHISAEYQDANVDPRFLKHATIQFWAGLADEDGNWSPNDSNFRFIGIVKHVSRKTQEGGLTVEIEAHDYTTLFLAQKPYASNGLPHLNSTLSDAWIRICEHVGFWDIDSGKMVSNVEALKTAIEYRGGVDGSRIIGAGVPKRIRDFGRIPHKNGDSAWDVWTRCCFCLGLITFFDKDKVVVTTSTEHFSVEEAPALIYGINILEADEVVDTSVTNKGIGLVSYDVMTGKTIEAYYPQPGDVRINVKRTVARSKSYKPSDVQADQYEVYEFHDVSDADLLLKIAQRAYEERSRQEIQGIVKTAEPVAYTPSGEAVDLMDLSSGDNIRIQIDPESLELIKNDAPALATQRLIDLGYEPRVAYLLSKNLDSMGTINSNMHTRQVSTHLDGDAETFEVSIRYWNTIKPLGGDSAG
jgi:hypothetical protein